MDNNSSDIGAIECGPIAGEAHKSGLSELTGLCHLDSPPPAPADQQQRLAGDEPASEIESTCTVLAASTNPSERRISQNDEQILSAQKLLHIERGQQSAAGANKQCDAYESPSKSVCCIEIHLNSDSDSRNSDGNSNSNSSSSAVADHEHSGEPNSNHQASMFSPNAPNNYRPNYISRHLDERQQTKIHAPSAGAVSRQRGPSTMSSNSAPKLTFSSRRMREYFESFKSHSEDTLNLYQFFKSIRTELVACLLFALISSHSLIIFRSSSSSSSSGTLAVQLDSSTSTSSSSSPLEPQTRDSPPFDGAGQVWPQLISGLVVCLLVASLTQVFGHVSGCHLIPSVSLALFIKGHIGRTRLIAYLAAQAVGAQLGIGLLALLTSSQLPASSSLSPLDKSSITGAGFSARLGHINLAQQPPTQPAPMTGPARARRRRRRREAQGAGEWDDIDLSAIQGSETILLSIMEQQQKQQHQETKTRSSRKEKEYEQVENVPGAAASLASGQKEKTITLSGSGTTSTYHSKADPSLGAYLLALGGPIEAQAAAGPTERTNPNRFSEGASDTTNDESRVSSAGSVVRPSFSNNSSTTATAITTTTAPPPMTTTTTPTTTTTTTQTATTKTDRSMRPAETISENSRPSSLDRQLSPAPTKLKRAKRNKHKQQQHLATNAADPSTETITSSSASSASASPNGRENNGEPATSNMLAWALPEPIMSADSIRQCSLAQPSRRLILANCLGLSNASQMFVFQLLASALVVLVYLANVDPRRIDVGFKSLSIGLGYFVATVLTINSGGFYGNPFQLLALAWFRSRAWPQDLLADHHQLSWRSEWWIYLIAPLIGGLFGAISHEYIDFSPLKRRPLKLRRSFHSINSSSVCAAADFKLRPHEANNDHVDDDDDDDSEDNDDNETNVDLHSAQSIATSPRGQSRADKRPQRRPSADCSSAPTPLNYSPSTNLDLDEIQQQQQQQQRRQEAERNRKLGAPTSSYSRQLSREHQRLQQQQQRQQHGQTCGRPVAAARRASDFDANFLISSSSSTSSSSQPAAPPSPPQRPLQLPPQTPILSVARQQPVNNGTIRGQHQLPACCSRRTDQMMISTSVM